ncbi:TonB-dependent receptor [Komagataeibacter xylinus NBRC 13693]|uniref:TonB-dependent receptor n=1 Tax=Komagataeibacter xylinus NBRC 13693 TaxID=1234668 RepID=A0A0D6Q9H1_KOMXY|nr:TonB-dependent receptor [Komagataeibacter xylinus]GAN99963.1 TonB-dependent receptor [Komagataeibacter xylinus NBRC 13693]
MPFHVLFRPNATKSTLARALRSRKSCLVMATVLGGLGAMETASAQQAPSVTPTSHARVVKKGTATTDTSAKATQSPDHPESISVTAQRNSAPGGGMMRRETAAHAVQTVTQDYIAMQSPTSAPLDLIRNLPSVNVSSSDPSGIDGGAISSRGLNDNDIGVLINGMPISNGSTSSATGFIQNYVDSNNIAAESMSPGSTSVGAPLNSAAAGSLEVTTRAPSEKFGGMISGSYGTFDTSREFLRVDSGEIGHSGVTSYISLSHTRAEAWRGSGISDRKHLDYRLQKKFNDGSTIDFFLGYNHSHNFQNRFPTMANLEADMNGTKPSIPLNYDADPIPSSPQSYYGVHGNDKDTFYTSLPVKLRLNHQLSLSIVPYYERSAFTLNTAARLQEGHTYSGSEPVAVDLNGDGAVTSAYQDVSEPAISLNQQGGVVSTLHWHLKNNEGQIGYWYEQSSYSLKTPVQKMNQVTSGQYADNDTSTYYHLADGSIYYATNYLGTYRSHTGFVEDTQYFLNHKMSVTAGFKIFTEELTGQSYLPGSNSRMTSNFVSPMPRFSWSWNLTPHHQIYVNAEGDFRAPSPEGLVTRYSLTSGAMTTSGANVKPQYSIKEELGYRYSGKFLIADVSLYNFNITNRLLTLNTYTSNNDAVSETVNAGGETIRGVDVMLSTRPLLHRFRPYVSFEYLHATMDNNLPAAAENGQMDYLRTKGNTPVMTPKVMFSIGTTYNEGPFFMNFSLHYTGRQYSSFMNDEYMSHYYTDTLSLGYHFPKIWRAQSPTFQLNFTNLTGTYKAAGVYSFSTNAHPTYGLNGNRIASGGSPLYYPMANFSMIGTVSTSF